MERGSFVQEFIAGNVGGILGITAVYPLDTLKIRQQTNPNSGSIIEVFNSMRSADGIKSLYRGILSPVAGFGFTFAVSFSAYGASCRYLAAWHNTKVENISLGDMTLAGAITGLVQSPFRQVMERIKSVMQVREGAHQKSPYSWSGACLVDLVKKEGLKNGLFRGMTSLIYREVPQFAVYYPAYHLWKQFFMELLPENVHLACFLSGGSAGVTQWLPPILCMDAVKSHMQTAAPGTYTVRASPSVGDCISKMYSTHGIRIFFRGFTAAMLRAFPLHGIVFLGYEFAMMLMNSNKLMPPLEV